MLDHQLATMPISSASAIQKPEAQQAKPMSSFHRLIEACKHKNLDQIKTLLDGRPELINRCDRHRRSLLHYVSVLIEDDKGEPADRASACFDYLLALAGEKLWWHQDHDGLSTLHLAVVSGHLPMVEHLTVVHPMAAREPKLATLLDREGHSPLHWAVLTNNLASARLLIQSGGLELLYQQDANHASPIHYATQFGSKLDYRNRIKRLLHGERSLSASREEDGGLAATNAAEPVFGVLQYLVQLDGVELERKDRDHRSALLWAASSGNSKAIEILLKRGADPLSCDTNGLTALHCAASHGFVDSLEALLEGAPPDSVKVNLPDNLGCTPLFYAVLSGNQECIELLIKHGAQLDWQDSKGRTVAHFASLKGQLSSLKLLQESGGNLWLPNKLGDLPLHYAIKGGRPQVVRWLLEHSPYEHPVNAINNLGRAPIHLAVQRDDMELIEYLTSCGANLNQLAKLRHLTKSGTSTSTSDVKYETALDLASRLGNKRAMEFLAKNNAKSASQVLNQRHLFRPQVFQSVEVESPIGFETSCSSASPKQSFENQPSAEPHEATHEEEQVLDVHQESSISDSTGSSAMSHSSATSLQERCRADTGKQEQSLAAASEGGISYSNDHICASIKCKLYPNESHHQTTSQRADILTAQQLNKPPEVVTNVRVYTSPCQSCHPVNENAANNHWLVSPYFNPTSSYIVDESGYHKLDEHPGLAHQRIDEERPVFRPYDCAQFSRSEGDLRSRFESRSLEVGDEDDRLPVILSEQELSSCSASPVQECEESADGAAIRRKTSTRSPANEEPRFDRLRTETRKFPRKNVTSPVGEYIHSSLNSTPGIKKRDLTSRQNDTFAPRPTEAYRRFQSQSYYKVPAKVDTHWHHRSDRINKSKRQSPMDYSYERTPSSVSTGGPPSRSVSRQTVVKVSGRRFSGGSEELASRVEKTIWKYRQETKLFEELQNLKRSQIRSGKANEAVLVKRLLDRLRVDATSQMIGLDNYQGPYTYKAYERYLYDQLRKLSMSNRAKLNVGRRSVDLCDDETTGEFNEDARAELELRRILEDSDRYSESSRASVVGNREATNEGSPDEEPAPSARESQRESVHERCLSRDSTQQSKEEAGPEGFKVAASPAEQSETIKEEADNLSSSIIVDALGNLTSAVHPLKRSEQVIPDGADAETVDEAKDAEDKDESVRVEKRPEENVSDLVVNAGAIVDGEEEKWKPSEEQEAAKPGKLSGAADELANKSLESTPNNSKHGRRRSVINIGDKIDVIYHDIGIEIEPAPANPVEDASEKQQEAEQVADAAETSAEAPSSSSKQEPTVPEEEEEEEDDEAETEVGEREENSGREEHVALDAKSEEPEQQDVQTEPRKQPKAGEGELPLLNSHRSRIARKTSLPQECASRQPDQKKATLVRQAMSVTDREPQCWSSSKQGSSTGVSSPTKKSERSRKWRAQKASERSVSKRPRSIPPSVVYRPSVDVRSIHDRWSKIKADERSRLRSHNDLRQPDSGDEQADSELDYLLLYEINRGLCRHLGSNNKLETSGKNLTKTSNAIVTDWCQRRVRRILDARQLKRTLSLPECLIYSNKLLRQFEILRL